LESGAPIAAHWRIPIGCCYEGPDQLISINKLESGGGQGQSTVHIYKKQFNYTKWKLGKITGNKGPIRKILKNS
jgi:hypothetical protein